MVNKPAHISGSFTDHIYIKKSLNEEFLLMQLFKKFTLQIMMLQEL